MYLIKFGYHKKDYDVGGDNGIQYVYRGRWTGTLTNAAG